MTTVSGVVGVSDEAGMLGMTEVSGALGTIGVAGASPTGADTPTVSSPITPVGAGHAAGESLKVDNFPTISTICPFN